MGGTPPSLSTVVSKLESLELPKTTAGQLVSPSMSYVSSCSFTSFSDCNVVVKKKQQKISNKNKEKKANNNKIMNTLLNSVNNNNNDNNKNKNSNKVNIGRSIIPSTIRQMFSGRNNKEVGVEPQQQLPPLDKKNLPQQNHSSGHFSINRNRSLLHVIHDRRGRQLAVMETFVHCTYSCANALGKVLLPPWHLHTNTSRLLRNASKALLKTFT